MCRSLHRSVEQALQCRFFAIEFVAQVGQTDTDADTVNFVRMRIALREGTAHWHNDGVKNWGLLSWSSLSTAIQTAAQCGMTSHKSVDRRASAQISLFPVNLCHSKYATSKYFN
jgi:hypothetical protein